MRKITNPYQPYKIPDAKDAFFGREEIATWVEQQIIAQRRLLILYGLPLIGKTTLLGFLPQMLTLSSASVPLSFSELSDYSGNAVLAYLIQELTGQLDALNLIAPGSIPTATDAVSALDHLLAQFQQRSPDTELLLLIDDFDALLAHAESDMALFLDIIRTLLVRHPFLHFILTAQYTSLPRLQHPLLDSAPVQQITTLSPNDALQMITSPVDKVIRFDYGVPKRIADINSNHPHYLSIFNNALFARCAREGWVNLRHLDETLDDVLAKDLPSFRQVWREASLVERAALVATATVRGGHGVFTRQEVAALALRQDKKADEEVILTALESLAYQGVLVKMGALSYKFYVDLLRFWLQKNFILADVLQEVSWQQPTARAEAEPLLASDELQDGEGGQKSPAGFPLWILALAGFTVIAILLAGIVFLGDKSGIFIAPASTAEAQSAAEVISFKEEPLITPTITPTPAPTGTSTPTPPIVVAKSLPSIAYMARQADGFWQLYLMDIDGSGVQPVFQSESDETSPVWSPSGNKLAFVSERDGNREIYVMDRSGQNPKNITNHPDDDWTPAWSPDGSHIAFSSNRDGAWQIFVANADGSNLQQITDGDSSNISPVWSPDGEMLALSSKRDGNWEIYTMRADGKDQRRLTHNEVNDLAPIWSPDGSLIAYETNLDGNVEVYVMAAAGGNPRNITNMSYANDHGPVWSPDGERLIFYSNREGNWDIFITHLDGSGVVNLTNTPDVDEQTPVWRP
ncbi:MAG: hypothetical protein B6243_05070 [Anaerolineaceae bacterium 4572_5.2]|nr:MAG: hypothetical protein B6243_05070 [Anaerolineaceae bacterium 4572_5.2]